MLAIVCQLRIILELIQVTLAEIIPIVITTDMVDGWQLGMFLTVTSGRQ